jgi:predicted Zn-dependent protease
MAKGATDRSLTYVQQVLTAQPSNPEARDLLVRSYVQQGNVSKAREVLANDFVGAVALESFCSRIPAGDDARRIEHADRVVRDGIDEQTISFVNLIRSRGRY